MRATGAIFCTARSRPFMSPVAMPARAKMPTATRWSAANTPRLVLPASLTKLVYYSRIESGAAVQRACGEADLDSCGCLDFIPPRSHYSFRTP